MSGYGNEVTIDGRTYPLVQEQYGRRYLDVVRQQGGTENEPSERSLNPNDLWRRSQDDWIFGEGQLWYDDDESVKKRYRQGTAIDPFTVKGELRLGPGRTIEDTYTAQTIAKCIVADGFIWTMFDADTTLERFNGTTSTTTGTVPQNIVDIATDGSNVYIACRDSGKTTGGVYIISAGSTSPTLLNTIIPDKIAFVLGRLIVTAGADVYNITDVSVTTPPAPLTSTPINDSFVWDSIGAAENFILVSGHGGDLSLVYRITIREDGTSLTPPVQCGQLPDAEYVTAIKQYLGVLVLGTSNGIRIAQLQNGSLIYGKLVEDTPNAVTGLEPQDRFVYYGCEAGVHRLDLSRFLPQEPLVPAYARYLELAGSGPVPTVCWYDGKLHAGYDDDLVSVNSLTYTGTTGVFYSGRITYGMADKKHFHFVDMVTREPDVADEILVEYTTDDVTWTTAGTLTSGTPSAQFLLDVTAEWIELRFTFTRGSPTTTPVIERFTVRAMPIPRRTRQVQVPLDLRRQMVDGYGAPDLRDVMAEVRRLETLVDTGESVIYEEFDQEYTVGIENVQLGPDLDIDVDNAGWEGIVIVTMRIYA